MKAVIAIIIGAFCASTVQAETFVVQVKGVVQSAFGQGGGVLDAVESGDAVTETFAFDTARFPLSAGDGATALAYQNPYLSPVDAVRSRITVGSVAFNVEGYPLLVEGAAVVDSLLSATPPGAPPGFPPPVPPDRFALNDGSATAALNVPAARGLIRWAIFGASAPGASSLVTVPVTSIADVSFTAATAFASSLSEVQGWVNPALPPGGVSFGPDARFVLVTVQSATLRRCEHRLRWLDAGLPWPRHGIHCETAEVEGDDD